MIDRQQFLIRARLETETLTAWIEEEWLAPREEPSGPQFSEADIARVRLIQDLRQDLGVNDEGIAVILNLIDQVHGLRKTLRELLRTVRSQTDFLNEKTAPNLHDEAP
jgi:chaperone modulatory protein CbpM